MPINDAVTEATAAPTLLADSTLAAVTSIQLFRILQSISQGIGSLVFG